MKKAVIGLEIHIEEITKTKMFCACPAIHFQEIPNSHVCPVCLGLPGALPYANEKAIENVIKLGIALNCNVNRSSKFDRKHYFYPDLPKGYQISQYDIPLCENGYLNLDNKKVHITRVHLEEDTGKLLHKGGGIKKYTLVDFNRSGIPLIEIVTEPDLSNSQEAVEFAKSLKDIVTSLGISTCDMEKGFMRIEANISLGLDLGYKVELKNINSFKFIKKAIDYEIERQHKLINSGKKVSQETRGWDEKNNRTYLQRYKETQSDYRYFPEPDLPPIDISQNQLKMLKMQIKNLPKKVELQLVKKYGLRKDYAKLISINQNLHDYIYEIIDVLPNDISLNDVASLIINKKVDYKKIQPKELLNKIVDTNKGNITDKSKISDWIDISIKENPKAFLDYKGGKLEAISVIIGGVMKISKGRADPNVIKKLLSKKK